FELESDKAAQTVTAQAAGVLRVKAKEGDTVPIGAVVGEIDTSAAPAPASGGREPPGATTKSGAKSAESPPPPAEVPGGSRPPLAEPSASPAARRVLAERGLEPAQVPGTGPKGLVTKEDAVAFQPNGPPASPPTPTVTPTASRRETRKPMSMIR